MIIVSACLAGVNCRYDGKGNKDDRILKLVKDGKAMLVCPEQLGGLTTPREPAEIAVCDDKIKHVVDKRGQDYTKEFIKGAEETLNIAKMIDANIAILKARSPSCGFGEIYDGTFSGKITKGNGLTAEILSSSGIKVYSEENLPQDLFDNLK